MTKGFVCFESDDITSIHYIVYCSIMSISCSARDRTSMNIRQRRKAAPKPTLYWLFKTFGAGSCSSVPKILSQNLLVTPKPFWKSAK